MRLSSFVSIIALSSALTACGGDETDNSPAVPVNAAPIVDAGAAKTADERTPVELEGTLTDSEGDATIRWSQVSGPMVNLNSETILNPRFMAPPTNADATIVMRLTATDAQNTVSDDVEITINDRTPSPQGINEDTNNRRERARNDRNGNRPMIDSREVRTYNGTNNNLTNTTWGASFTQLARWGDADYGDLISTLAGSTRPSAREVSNKIVAQDEGVSIPNSFGTSDFLWQWGQFLDHDIGITDGAEESADIAVPIGDVFFDPNSTGEEVILFNRAFFDHDTGTSAADPRQQENEITAWIDGSNVYGSDDERALALRVSADSPFLASSAGNLLPFNTAGITNANGLGAADESLFVAGDVRVNEQVGLASMHTLWMREHNRIATILQSDFPTATGEEIFQAARRLVVAKLQIITYEEYLPALMGANALSPYTGYDPSVNPGMFNEFSVAAYRYGHSLVSETLQRFDADGAEVAGGHLSLRSAFFTAPAILTDETSIDPVLRGLATQISQELDEKANNDLRNFLFGQPGQGGFDLLSLNIQRGRDHGVPSYNDMREVMGLARVTTFAEITSDPTLQAALADTYTNVDDIDLWVGGLSEDALTAEGSQLGELFRVMHIRQFEAFRDGDRFWYQNDLTPPEMDRVRNTTLANVIRANTSIGDELQDNVFFAP